MRIYRRLLKYYDKHIGKLTVGIVCMILSSILLAVSRLLIKPLIDKVFINKDMSMLISLLIAIIMIYLFLGIFTFIKNYLTAQISQKIVLHIRNQMYSNLQNLSLDFYANRQTGEIMSRVTNDVSLLQNALAKAPAVIVCDGLSVLCLLGVLFYLHLKLALICIGVFFIAIFPITIFGKKMRYYSLEVQKMIANLYSHLQESILGINITKAFSCEELETRRFEKVNNWFYDLMMKFIRVDSMNSPVMEFIGAIAVSVVLFIAAVDVIADRWSTGAFFAFIGTALAIGPPLRNLVQLNPCIQQALSASERIFALIDEKSKVVEKESALVLPDFKNSIVFDNVSFSYKKNQTVLKNINLVIKSNEIIGIVGPSGSGKTTLLNLLMRFYDPTEGRILIDGYDLRDITFDSLRSQIAVVTQDTILFNETIRYNISYGKMDATDEEIIKASIAANAHEFIVKMPNGYNTVIGEKGVFLSGGERQRIAIARAVIKNPKILLLDEATSALDAESEKIVQEALEKLMVNKTVLMIAHRLSTVKNCNRIIVLDKGMIVDEGTHDELFHKEGLYKRLHDLQLV